MYKGGRILNSEEIKRIDELIRRAIPKLAEEKGIEVSFAEAKEIFKSQIEFIEKKIGEGTFETISMPHFVKFEANQKQVRGYYRFLGEKQK